MKYKDYNIQVFFNLLRAGLFPVHGEGNSDIRIDGTTDWNYIYRLAQEQSVQGIVLCGIEELRAKGLELSVPKVLLLQWIGEVQMIEQRNKEMNVFVADLIEKLRRNDIYAILVKGQGIAQCYEKPLWRCSGDVDLLLDRSNYQKAKKDLQKGASYIGKEGIDGMHLGMNIAEWEVELHGTLHSELSINIDKQIDRIQETVFKEGRIRSWHNGDTDIFLPAPDEDVIFVFTHILQHFYKGGIGLRQICDWCRLLYTYGDSLNYGLLESRIKTLGLKSEWKAFGTLAVEYLGMPEEAMPFLNVNDRNILKKKAERILDFVIMTGNFGHNRDMSYYGESSYLRRKFTSLGRRCVDMLCHIRIFPVDSFRFFGGIVFNGIRSMMRGL